MTISNTTKIVYLINGLKPGGGERMLQQLVGALPDKPVIYCLTRKGSVADEISALGISVVLLRFNLFHWVKFFRSLRKADILHTHFFYSDLIGFILGKIFGVRLISTRHETGFWMQFYHRFLERLFYSRFDCIIAVSKAVEQSLIQRRISADKIVLIHPGVEVLDFAKKPNVNLRILSVGRLEYVKGHDVLLKALGPYECIIVGDGSEREKLAQSHTHCRFVGSKSASEVREYLQTADIFVLPSRSEGLPLSLLEAMASKVACIASNVGGIPEVIQHGVNGLLVPSDNVKALHQAIEQLANSPTLRHSLGEAAFAYVSENFSQAKFVKKTQNVYAKKFS